MTGKYGSPESSTRPRHKIHLPDKAFAWALHMLWFTSDIIFKWPSDPLPQLLDVALRDVRYTHALGYVKQLRKRIAWPNLLGGNLQRKGLYSGN